MIFKHYLTFDDLGIELFQISEPKGFDVANFVIKQREASFGRDVFFANETVNLEFTSDEGFELGDEVKTITPYGTQSQYLTHGLAWILEARRRKGFEAKVHYILLKDNIQFTVGVLDLANVDTDGKTFLGCQIIQQTEIANYKRNLDTKIDLFATKNIKGEVITPAPTMRFLLKSTPRFEVSTFKSTTPVTFGAFKSSSATGNKGQSAANNANIAELSEIASTLSFASLTYATHDVSGTQIPNDSASFCILNTQSDLTDVELELSKIIGRSSFAIQDFFATHVTDASGYCKVLAVLGNDLQTEPFDVYELYSKDYAFPSDYDGTYNSGIFTFPDTIKYTIPLIERGKKLYLYIATAAEATFNLFNPDEELAGSELNASLNSWAVRITATSNGLDNVISGVRQYDVMIQCSKFIDGLFINASEFEKGGEHYNNVCWNRNLISKTTSNSIQLLSATLPDGNEIGQVVYNTLADTVPIGLYFWNGAIWKQIYAEVPRSIELESVSVPSGNYDGELAFNTNELIDPVGLCYWNGEGWQSLELSQPFVTSFKDIFENGMTIETCSDYEIKNDRIEVLPFKRFYGTSEDAVFEMLPSKEYRESDNPRFQLNNVKLGFETFEQNRLSPNTTRDIFTTTERAIPNKLVEDKFDRSIKHVRSIYSQQATADLEIKTPQTSDENDDKVNVNSIVPLIDGVCHFNARLFNQIVGTELHVLNRASDTDASNVYLNWNTRGLALGQNFYITVGHNTGTYTVVAWTNDNLRLNPVGFSPSFNGNNNCTIEYDYIGLEWQTKTNEGFSLIDGIFAEDKYGNLDYSLGRILHRWLPYLSSACQFHLDKVLKKLYFKNNPVLKTQKPTEPIIYEAKDILCADLPKPILGTLIYDLEVEADFIDVLNLLNAVNSTRGFVRCLSVSGRVIKGYVQELDYTWKTGTLKLKLEQKFEPTFLELTVQYAQRGVVQSITVNDTVYNLYGVLDWWRLSDKFITIFDKKHRPISSPTRYDMVKLNGIIYGSEILLSEALENL